MNSQTKRALARVPRVAARLAVMWVSVVLAYILAGAALLGLITGLVWLVENLPFVVAGLMIGAFAGQVFWRVRNEDSKDWL